MSNPQVTFFLRGLRHIPYALKEGRTSNGFDTTRRPALFRRYVLLRRSFIQLSVEIVYREKWEIIVTYAA